MDETEAQDMGMPRSPFPERRLPSSTPEDLPMDVDLLKVLASDSRRQILQQLRKRRMTLTELAHALDLKKATVLEHLKKLTDAGLIRRLEDERLWVYYELTHRGGRVVNPGRTRFYLLMSVAAAAALVLGGVTAALLATDVLDASPRSSAGADHAATAETPMATGGAGVAVNLRLEEGASARTRAYLVSEDDAASLRASDGAVAGIPLALDAADGDVARYRSLSAVPPGNYYLYVVDDEGRDNLDTLGAIRIPSLDARAPDALWRGLSGDAEFSLARDERPADGTLLLVASAGRELPTLALANGTATLDAATLDRLVPATYDIQYNPNGSQFWITLDRRVDVREPLWAVEPRYAIEGEPTPFRVALASPGDPAPPLARPGLAGASPLAWTADADGTGVLATFAPRGHGPQPFELGRLEPSVVNVVPDVRVRLDRENDTLTRLRLADADGAPLPEVAVAIGTRVLDLTDANGTVLLGTPADGAHELRFTLPDGTALARGLVFAGGNATEEPDRVRVRNVTAERDATKVVARGTLVNEGVATERVTLALRVNGRTVATTALEAAPGSALDVTLDASMRLPAGEHAVLLAASPLRHAPLAGSAVSVGAVGAPAPSAYYAYDDAGASNASARAVVADAREEAVLLKVAAPTAPPVQVVRLENRSSTPVADASSGTPVEAPAAQVPGAGAALVAVAAVGVALALRRRAR